jgi:hypothetical protein
VFDFWFSLMIIVLLAAVPLRFIRRSLEPVTLEKVGQEAATQMVRDFLDAATDTQFGFPTGFFSVDHQVSTDWRIIAREAVFWESNLTTLLRLTFHIPKKMGRILGEIFHVWLFVLAGYVLGAVIFLFVFPLILLVGLIEVVLRFLLRSEISAVITPLQGRHGSLVRFTLRGPSAFIVGKRLRQAFDRPVLPGRIRSQAGLAPALPAERGAASA